MNASLSGTENATTAGQVRAARGLLGWTRDQLVDASSVPKRTLVRFEDEEAVPRRATLAAIRTALEAAGVEFVDGAAAGVTLAAGLPTIRTGNDEGPRLDVPWLHTGSFAQAEPSTLPVVVPWGELEVLTRSADQEAGLIWLRQHLRSVGDAVRAKADRLMDEDGWTRLVVGEPMKVTAADLSSAGPRLRKDED